MTPGLYTKEESNKQALEKRNGANANCTVPRDTSSRQRNKQCKDKSAENRVPN